MRRAILFMLGMLLCTAGCFRGPQEKAITIVNAAAVDAPLLERLRSFAEQELHVPVRTMEKPQLAGLADFQALEKAAERVKTESDATLIVLAGFNNGGDHLMVDEAKGIALVNVQALYTDDSERFARRMERMVMRAAAFSFGLEPTPDPYCVTRDYTSLDDLDRMGRNYSPPWQGRFAEEAAKRGLKPLNASAAFAQ